MFNIAWRIDLQTMLTLYIIVIYQKQCRSSFLSIEVHFIERCIHQIKRLCIRVSYTKLGITISLRYRNQLVFYMFEMVPSTYLKQYDVL